MTALTFVTSTGFPKCSLASPKEHPNSFLLLIANDLNIRQIKGRKTDTLVLSPPWYGNPQTNTVAAVKANAIAHNIFVFGNFDAGYLIHDHPLTSKELKRIKTIIVCDEGSLTQCKAGTNIHNVPNFFHTSLPPHLAKFLDASAYEPGSIFSYAEQELLRRVKHYETTPPEALFAEFKNEMDEREARIRARHTSTSSSSSSSEEPESAGSSTDSARAAADDRARKQIHNNLVVTAYLANSRVNPYMTMEEAEARVTATEQNLAKCIIM